MPLNTHINSRTDVEAEQQLNLRAIELFQKHECTVVPRFPLVMVRVLPRDMATASGLYLPGGKQQNKPVYEGIVLRTWEPFIKEAGVPLSHWEQETILASYKNVRLEMKSELEVGDHIIFEHWAGLPAPGLHESFYRMVPEIMPSRRDKGPIYGKLEYQRENSTEKLYNILDGFAICNAAADSSTHDLQIKKCIQDLREDFDIIRKVTSCRTISGA